MNALVDCNLQSQSSTDLPERKRIGRGQVTPGVHIPLWSTLVLLIRKNQSAGLLRNSKWLVLVGVALTEP
jgi:hypothetical protein